jgi:uncharacterized OB-fold protein
VSNSFSVPACDACGHAIWPPRPVCPCCAGTTFSERDASRGIVEEATCNGEALLASVRSGAGPVVIARLERHAPAGAYVELTRNDAPGGDRIVLATPRA